MTGFGKGNISGITKSWDKDDVSRLLHHLISNGILAEKVCMGKFCKPYSLLENSVAAEKVLNGQLKVFAKVAYGNV